VVLEAGEDGAPEEAAVGAVARVREAETSEVEGPGAIGKV
jgi:hypothetical protein